MVSSSVPHAKSAVSIGLRFRRTLAYVAFRGRRAWVCRRKASTVFTTAMPKTTP